MTTYSISTAAQPLFPDGYNDAMTLFNQGPWTIYLDDNSSIGPQSYALKPSTTMVWPAGRPLWAMGNTPPPSIDVFLPAYNGSLDVAYNSTYQNSTLVATRGGYAFSGQYSGKSLFPIRKTSYTDTVSNATRKYSTDYPFECDSYDSLVITMTALPFNTTDNYTATLPNQHIVMIDWFDNDGNITASDQFILAEMYIDFTGSYLSQRIITDVKGKYALISHSAGDMTVAFTGQFAWTVQGSTAPLQPQSHHWLYQLAADAVGNLEGQRYGYSPVWMRNLAIPPVIVPAGSEHASIIGIATSKNIFLNNPSRKLQLSIRAVGITATANIHVHSSDVNIATTPGLVQTITVPVGTNTLGPYTINLPLSAFNWIQVGGGSGGTFHISLSWS